MEKEKSYYFLNAIRVCVDKNEDHNLRGRAYSRLYEPEIQFENFSHLLIEVDKVFDSSGYPQAFQEKRNFTGESSLQTFNLKPECGRDAENILMREGKIFTVDIVVKSRRLATWQGEVLDMQGNLIGKFEDAFQMIKIVTENEH